MKNIIKAFVIASAAILFAGCIKETFPQGSTQTAAQVASSTDAMINGMSYPMMASGFLGYLKNYDDHTDFGLPGVHFRTELMLEDLVTAGPNPYYNRGYAYALNQAQGETYIYCSYFWDAYYTFIKSANDIINVIDPETADESAILNLGKAYVQRAMCYLDLARLFEPKENKYTDVSSVLGLTVPIVTEKTTEQEAMNNPRAKREDMYEFILKDLDKAEEYFGETKMITYLQPSLAAAYGLKARAYLEMGYWKEGGDKEMFAKAYEYADLAITASGKTPLTQAQWEDPANGFNNGAANNAWIWGLSLSSENQENIITFTSHMSPEATWGYCGLSQMSIAKRLYEKIPDNDFRKHSYLDPEYIADPDNFTKWQYKWAVNAEQLHTLQVGKTGECFALIPYQAIKFRPAQGECSDFSVGNCADHPIMRVEEMWFIKMEALAGQGKISDACALLNEFMENRITDKSYSCSVSSQKAFINEMMLQKRIEFWGEGILFYDYKRLDMGITQGYEGTNQAPVYCFNTDGRSPQWNIVITRGEFQSNKGITTATNNPDPSDKVTQWSN